MVCGIQKVHTNLFIQNKYELNQKHIAQKMSSKRVEYLFLHKKTKICGKMIKNDHFSNSGNQSKVCNNQSDLRMEQLKN